jgi:Fic family protein
MQRADFIGSATGRLVPTERGQWAFVPNALPPAGLDHARITKALSDAAAAIGELNGIGRTLPNPYLLIRPLQRREVISSSSMEGTYTTVDELLLAEVADGVDASSDTREVLNYMHALADGIASLKTFPLSLRTLKDAHATLLRGVPKTRGASVRPGEFKQHQNFIGAYQIEQARFIPPPPREAEDCLSELEKYWHRDEDGLDILIDAALIHYQFETIHPFADGNGRVGRMLILLHLFMRQKLLQPLLYLSPVFERRKDEYIDRMYAVSRYGDWEGWVVFFLHVMQESAREAIGMADSIVALQRDYRERLQKARISANLLAAVDYLFQQPAVSIPKLREHLGVSYPAAKANVELLIREKILTEVAGSDNPRLFFARDIISIISGKTNA